MLLGDCGTGEGDQHEGNNNATQVDHDHFPKICRPRQVLLKDCCIHSSSMAPSISTDRLMPSTVRTTLAGKASLPFSLPPLTATRTACSISRCEVMPTFFEKFAYAEVQCMFVHDRLVKVPERWLSLLTFYPCKRANTTAKTPVESR